MKSTSLSPIRQTHSQMVRNWMGIKGASRIDQIDEIDTIVFHSTNTRQSNGQILIMVRCCVLKRLKKVSQTQMDQSHSQMCVKVYMTAHV